VIAAVLFTVALGVELGAPSVEETRRELVSVALQSKDPVSRDQATRILLSDEQRPALFLRGSLSDPDYRVRRRACRLLLVTGDERSLPALLEALEDQDPASDAKVAIAWTAFRLGHPPALEVVRAGLRSPWWHKRLNAVADLAVLEDAGAAALLAGALYDPSWLVRRRALRALRRLDVRPYARALVDLAVDEEWVIRREALEALLELGEPTGVSPLEHGGALAAALLDPEVAIRRMAAQALADRPPAGLSISESIRFSFDHDPDPTVRAALVRAIGRSPEEEGEKLVHKAAGDRSFEVRAAAVEVLRQKEPARAARLVAGIGLVAPSEVAAAARALRRVVDPGALPDLVRAALRGDAGAKIARSLLAELGRAEEWKRPLLEQARTLLAQPTGAARELAADLAARLGGEELAPALLGLVDDASAVVRAAALRAFESLGDSLSLENRGRVALALAPVAVKLAGPLAGALRRTLERLAFRGLTPGALRTLAGAAVRWVRTLSLRSLAIMGEGEDIARQALRDDEPEVRSTAVATLAAALPVGVSDPLASLGDLVAPIDERRRNRSLAEIAACLEDPAALVRRAAARALAALGRPGGMAELQSALREDLRAPSPAVRRRAAEELIRLGQSGNDEARDALVGALVDDDREVRTRAAQALLERPVAPALTAALGEAPPLRYAAARLLAARGVYTGLAGELRPLAEIGTREVERMGEYHPARLSRLLAEKLSAKTRTPALREYLRRFLAPDLIARLAEDLGREVVTHWRGVPAYNMRRQNLYNREIALAVRGLPGLHPKILKALLFQESNLEPLAGNKYDCVGLGAFCRRAAREEGVEMSATFRDFERDTRYTPEQAIAAAVRHLRRKAELLERGPFQRFGTPRGDTYWLFVLAAYNGGHEQVGEAMANAYKVGLELAKVRGLRGAAATELARAHAVRWENLLVPYEAPHDSPLHAMTERRYPWYRPYGRYRKMKGAEAKYHEIGNFPLDILDRAFEGEARDVN
jgi:HEAT repeat protein